MTDDNRPGLACARPHYTAPVKAVVRALMLLAIILGVLAPVLAEAQINWQKPARWSQYANSLPNTVHNVLDRGNSSASHDSGIRWSFHPNCYRPPERIWMFSYLDNHRDKFTQVRTGGNPRSDTLITLETPNSQQVHLHFKGNQRHLGTFTLSVRLVSNGCSSQVNGSAVFTVTVGAARFNNTVAHVATAAFPFRTDLLLSNTVDITTGIVLQRGISTCPVTDMRLLTHTDYLRLQILNPNSSNTLTGAVTIRHDGVTMFHGTATENRALAMLFKAGATVTPGTLQVEVQESSPGCGTGYPTTTTLRLTVADELPWVANSYSRAQATAAFMVSEGGSPQTGIQFASHIGILSARVCDQAVVEILDRPVTGARETKNARDIAQLAYFKGDSWQRRTGAEVTLGHLWADGHARLELRNSNNPPVGTLTITVVAKPHPTASDCKRPGIPEPLTVAYKITIVEEWEDLSRNRTQAASGFTAPALSRSQVHTDTGIRVHRSSRGCRYIDVRLQAPSYLGLMQFRMNGATTVTADANLAQQHHQVRMDTGAGGDDRHLRLMFIPRAAVGANTRVESVTVIGSPAAQCPVGRRPTVAFTTTYMLTINARYTVEKFAKDNIDTVGATLVIENVRNATAPLTIGVFVHRSSEGCRSMNVAVTDSNYLVQRVRAEDDVPVGTPSDRVSGVVMNGEEDATDSYVRLLVRPGQSSRERGEDNIPVEISPACALAAGAPLPETKRVRIAYENSWVVADGGFDRIRTEQTFPAGVLLTSSYTETGIVFHRRVQPSLNCLHEIDVDLVNGTEDVFALRKHRDNGTADGNPASSFDNVNVVSGGNRRHFRLLFKQRRNLAGGSVVQATLVSEARGNCTKPANLTLVYEVAIDYGQGEIPVAGEATGAAASRVIGLRGMDAVLERSSVAGTAGGLSLLEMMANKEAELESGEIDLRSFLAGQSFALGLDASASGRSRFGVWGRAETLALEGDGDDTALRHEGDMFAAQVGMDFRVASDALFGLGYGRYEMDTEYTGRKDGGGYKGNYVLALDLVQPYAAMPFLGGDLAAAASFGSGSAEFVGTGTSAYTDKHDAQYRGWGLGYRSQVPVASADVGVEGSVSGSLLEVPTLGTGMESDNMSLRLGLEFARSMDFAAGTVRPAAAAAYARDWGDDPGSKHEFSAGVGYEYGQLSALVEFLHVGMDAGDAKANGAALALRYAPASGALGLGLKVAPRHGVSPSTAGTTPLENVLATDAGLRGSAELSYGLPVDGGVLTPYGGWTFDGGASELGLRLRTGAESKWLLRWQGTAADELKIEYRLGD